MDNYTDSLVKKYENLPTDLKEALSSVPVAEKLESIAAQNDLHVDQAGFLQSLVEQVMTGIVHPKDFMPKMILLMQIDEAKAKNIVNQTNSEIFLPIRESLKKIHEIRGNEDLTELMTGAQPSSHEILQAISNPESIKKTSDTSVFTTPAPRIEAPIPSPLNNKVPEMPPLKVPITVPAPNIVKPTAPITPEVRTVPQQPSLPELKIKEVVQNSPIENVVVKTGVTLIPEDHKQRINSDHYKESI